MGVFANVPQGKYDLLSDEDKRAVDAWRNQEDDASVQAREAGNYGDVVSRDANKSVEKTPAKKSISK